MAGVMIVSKGEKRGEDGVEARSRRRRRAAGHPDSPNEP